MPVLLLVCIVFLLSLPSVRAEQRQSAEALREGGRQPAMRVAIDVRNGATASPSIIATALQEASQIWAPYGVRLEKSARRREALRGDKVAAISVTLSSTEARGGVSPRGTPLGLTMFSTNGEPMTAISIFYDAIVLAVGGGVVFGIRDVQSSAFLRERLVARMLGRTIAHELGHVMLRSPGHSSSGLMRAFQSATELAHPGSAGFALEPGDIARLQQMRDRASVATATRD